MKTVEQIRTEYIDKPTIQRIGLLHPSLRTEAMLIYNQIRQRLTGKTTVRFTHTLRTFAEQDALYAQGRTKPGQRVTNAKGGQSFHNYGLAIDICLLVDKDNNGTFEAAVWDTLLDADADGIKDWAECVAVFEEYGWEWGGRWRTFTDLPHFQKVSGKSVAQLLAAKKDSAGYVMV